MYSGDEYYGDDITSGYFELGYHYPTYEEEDEELTDEEGEDFSYNYYVDRGRVDREPSYDNQYSYDPTDYYGGDE